jgi:hypothetical protein
MNNTHSLSPDSSVTALIALLSVTSLRFYGDNWYRLDAELQRAADITANRIIMHAEFALAFFGGAQ